MRVILTSIVALLTVSPVLAQELTFTLKWHGQSFISLETPKGKKLVFDPHAIPEFGRPMTTADLILCSHRHDDHAQPEMYPSVVIDFNGLVFRVATSSTTYSRGFDPPTRIPPFPFGQRAEWVTTFISSVAWLAAGIGLFVGLPRGRTDEQASVGAVLTIIGVLSTSLLGFWNHGAWPSVSAPEAAQSPPAPAPEARPLSVDQARQYLTDWTRQRDGHGKTLAVFQEERNDLVNQLRSLGATSSDDLLQKPEARVLADELVDITRQIETLAAEADRLSLAVVKMNSVLRRIERRQRLSDSNGLSVSEHGMLEQSVRELEATLRQPNGLPPVVEDGQVKKLIESLLAARSQ